MKKRSRQSGQSTLEYLLVMMVVVGALLGVLSLLKKNQFFFNHLAKPFVAYFRYNYKYGDPAAQGWDEGSASRHIQISQPAGAGTFRLFRNKGH